MFSESPSGGRRGGGKREREAEAANSELAEIFLTMRLIRTLVGRLDVGGASIVPDCLALDSLAIHCWRANERADERGEYITPK
jgi:hypothetical protein